ncbi:MAG: RING finger protein [Candidatus Methanofastidiosia archaeon]
MITMDRCSICGETVQEDKISFSYCLNCRATFHYDCIKKRLYHVKACPNCNQSLSLLKLGRKPIQDLKPIVSDLEKEEKIKEKPIIKKKPQEIVSLDDEILKVMEIEERDQRISYPKREEYPIEKERYVQETLEPEPYKTIEYEPIKKKKFKPQIFIMSILISFLIVIAIFYSNLSKINSWYEDSKYQYSITESKYLEQQTRVDSLKYQYETLNKNYNNLESEYKSRQSKYDQDIKTHEEKKKKIITSGLVTMIVTIINPSLFPLIAKSTGLSIEEIADTFVNEPQRLDNELIWLQSTKDRLIQMDVELQNKKREKEIEEGKLIQLSSDLNNKRKTIEKWKSEYFIEISKCVGIILVLSIIFYILIDGIW